MQVTKVVGPSRFGTACVGGWKPPPVGGGTSGDQALNQSWAYRTIRAGPRGLPSAPFEETGSPGITVPSKRHLVVETLSVQVDVTPPGSKVEAFLVLKTSRSGVYLFPYPTVEKRPAQAALDSLP